MSKKPNRNADKMHVKQECPMAWVTKCKTCERELADSLLIAGYCIDHAPAAIQKLEAEVERLKGIVEPLDEPRKEVGVCSLCGKKECIADCPLNPAVARRLARRL